MYILHLSTFFCIFLFVRLCPFDFIECFTTTFLRAHSWLNWVFLGEFGCILHVIKRVLLSMHIHSCIRQTCNNDVIYCYPQHNTHTS